MKGYISSQDDQIRHDVIMQLLCHNSLNSRDIEHNFSINFREYFEKELASLKELEEDGVINVYYKNDQINLEITEAGRLLVRCVCMAFDKYLTNNNSFSKVI
jgi:oxygen-independent coproporphyrinogen-3 oxidase